MTTIILKGLKATDYVHPQETAFRHSDQQTIADKGLDALNDMSVTMLKKITLGKNAEVTRATSPRLMTLLDEVCRTLDFPQRPHLYIGRRLSQEISVGGTDHMQILMPDTMLTMADEGMLRYALGNAVAMFKAGHVKLATICSVMGDGPATLAFRLPLQAWMRACDLSSDRGGLLACQDIGAAIRFLLWEAGLPVKEMAALDETGLLRLADDYIDSMQLISQDWLTSLAAGWKRINWADTPAVIRLQELLAWYRSDYPTLMNRWKGW